MLAAPRHAPWAFKLAVFEVGSEGTTPHLVGVEHLQIARSQSIAELQALFDFEKYFSKFPFHILHRSLDLNLSSKERPKTIFFEVISISCHMCQVLSVQCHGVHGARGSWRCARSSGGAMSRSARRWRSSRRCARSSNAVMSF